MPGVNLTGQPNVQNYELGRGKLYLGDLDSSDVPGPYRDLGNAPKFSYKVTSTELEHQSSREGIKDTDASVPIERKITGSFELDEMEFNNIALLVMGTASTAQTNAAVAGITSRVLNASVELGRWYDIVNASGVRAYDITTGDLSLSETAGPTPLVEGTDYELDLDMGRIFLLSNAVNIAAGESLTMVLAAKAGAKTLDVIKALQVSSVIKSLKFLSRNPANDDAETEYEFHKVSIRPAADVGLIDDKFKTMGFEFTAYKSSATRYADSPTLTITTHANANNDQ